MKIKPLGDRVLIERSAAETKSEGGIFIPENAKEAPVHGTVLAVGPGRVMPNGEVRPLDVQVGEKVLFGKYVGADVELDGKKLVMMTENDILGVLGK